MIRYEREIQLTKVLYFHRISDTHMTGNLLKNFRMFERLCGTYFEIILVTTMWDDVEVEIGEMREDVLKTCYWKSLITGGASVQRFFGTHKSAFDVLDPIIDKINSNGALLLQKEVNDLRLQLDKTAAAGTLYLLGELLTRQQEFLKTIRNEFKQPTLDSEQLEALLKKYITISKQLKRSNDDLKKRNIPVGERMERVAKTTDVTRALRWVTDSPTRVFSLYYLLNRHLQHL